jgi:hypothetical protein
MRGFRAPRWFREEEEQKQQADQQKQRMVDDQEQYRTYCQAIEDEQRRVPPAHRMAPVTFEEWSKDVDPAISDASLRGAQATNAALLRKVRMDEAAEVRAGKADPSFQMPESAKGLRMSVAAAKVFARKQAELFVEHNPEYHPSSANVAAITKYLTEQGVVIPNEECLRVAWLRLRELRMIEERPIEPEPEPAPAEPVPEPEDLVDGFDIQTGEPRRYSQREVWHMDSTTFRKAFQAFGDNRPRFTRGYFGRE